MTEQWADGGCDECAGENVVWFTDSPLWNEVMKGEQGRVLCVHCFVKRAEQMFSPTGWRLSPEWPWRVL